MTGLGGKLRSIMHKGSKSSKERADALAHTVTPCVPAHGTATEAVVQPSQAPQPQPRRLVGDNQRHVPGTCISDSFTTLGQVQQQLRREGLEASSLVLAIDFTKSNRWNGEHTFGGLSLHDISPNRTNPYQQVIKLIGSTLQDFDDDELYPTYGFGDATSADRAVFSFYPDDKPCQGLEDVLARYTEVARSVALRGPTSFAPAIYQAMRQVIDSGCEYHILVLIADGQVTQEQPTIDAIVAASELPLSIVMVGVGDGPWDMMQDFDDKIPARAFDNFQFVNFQEVMAGMQGQPESRREAAFALHALMEIPQQYNEIKRLGLLSKSNPPTIPKWSPPLPPPPAVLVEDQKRQQQQWRIEQAISGCDAVGPGYPHPHHAQPAASLPTVQEGCAPESQPSIALTPFGDPNVGPGIHHHRGLSRNTSNMSAHSDAVSARSEARSAATTVQDNELFQCPILLDEMDDPVVAADGYTYERFAIEAVIAKNGISPMTGQPLEHHHLTPNHVLRSAIQEARARQQHSERAAATEATTARLQAATISEGHAQQQGKSLQQQQQQQYTFPVIQQPKGQGVQIFTKKVAALHPVQSDDPLDEPFI